MIPGFQGTIPGFQGTIPGFQGTIPGFQGTIPGFQGAIPVFQKNAGNLNLAKVSSLSNFAAYFHSRHFFFEGYLFSAASMAKGPSIKK